MAKQVTHWTVTKTSPASQSASPTTDIHKLAQGLDKFDELLIDAVLTEATGGTLDVYLQRLVYRNPTSGAEVWADWTHFAQLAAGSTSYYFQLTGVTAADIVTVGHGTATDATPALGADAHIGGYPGTELRIAFAAGASTSAGADQIFYLTGITNRT